MTNKLAVLLLLVLLVQGIHAQDKIDTSDYPVVGRACPEFTLRNIAYYSKKSAVKSDFKGKWLVLDFWAKTCGACIASFPTVNQLYKKYGDKVQYMLIGEQDKEKQLQLMYARFRENLHLTMPCSFDSLLFRRWAIHALPRIILLDPEGIVRAITGGITSEQIEGFLSGNPPTLDNKQYDWQKNIKIPFDSKKPYLAGGNGGSDDAFIYRSVLSEFNPARQQDYIPRDVTQDLKSGKFQAIGTSLQILFNYSFYGTIHPDKNYYISPVLEVKDTAVFKPVWNSGKHLFSYSLIVPVQEATKEKIQSMMRRDLENYFGMTASIEERNFPCWRLVASEKARQQLQTKGGSQEIRALIPKVHMKFRNFPFATVVMILRNFTDADILDESGIAGNVDIELNCILTDINEVRKELATKGLELLPSTRKQKVLVIRDADLHNK